MADDWGICRIRSDGIEEKEARINMFKLPHHMPIGRERARMSDTQFQRRIGPVLEESKVQENAIKDCFNQAAKDIHGGEKIRGIVFGRGRPEDMHIDDWGVARSQNDDPFAGKDNHSQLSNIFCDDYASQLMDGQGDGQSHYHKGALHAHRHANQLGKAGPPPDPSQFARNDGYRPPQGRRPRLVPTSAMLAADSDSRNWVVDRDQRLDYATDPAALLMAAQNAEEDKKIGDRNRRKSRRSMVAMGDYDLNPGGHALNDDLERADDYGICRLRSDAILGPTGPSAVASLLKDPDPRDKQQPSPAKFAKNQLSTVFDQKPADPPYRGPFAGRRSHSVVMQEQAGPAPPVAARGQYITHDFNGGPKIGVNPHAGVITNDRQMVSVIKWEPQAQHEEEMMKHANKRNRMPINGRRVPMVEDVVFDKQGPLFGRARETQSEPSYYVAEVSGKRGAYQMPEAQRAVRMNIGRRELGGPETREEPNPPPPKIIGKYYEDHDNLLHYNDREACLRNPSIGEFPPPPPPLPHSVVAEAIAGGEQPPTTYSAEPGLPKRHPGPERLVRGRGVDGAGRDYRGRQLATSLVDEVIFGRSNYQGKMNLANNGANFTINQDGNFGHR